MKSAHSCTLSNELKDLSTCCVYFLNFGSDAYFCINKEAGGDVGESGKSTVSSGPFPRYSVSELTMVGGFWDYRLFGGVRASGLHAQLVDVKIQPKEV